MAQVISDKQDQDLSLRLKYEGMPAFEKGSVWLVGAGPGDPKLLTLLAVWAIQQADVILYDALVSKTVLDLAQPSVRLVDVGKRAGRSSKPQAEINDLIVEEAKQGNRVLRLKGGDPLVFARGGEEAMALVPHAIQFRFVPGITSGVAALSYAGIPSTHRDVNQSITFISAHDRSGGINQSLDWAGHAKTAEVLVVYMGSRLLGDIASRLLAGGRDPDEPLAVISRATWDDQKVVVSTLGQAPEDQAIKALPMPVLIVIGQTIGLRDDLDWFSALEPHQVDRTQGE